MLQATRSLFWVLICLYAAHAQANEVTVQNDSLVNNAQGTIEPGFAADEAAATWLTSPCDGNIVAVDVLWRSLNGGAAQSVEEAIAIYSTGVFPYVTTLLENIVGPVMTDGVINEFRYLDENNTIPLSVPVTQGATYAIAFFFANAPNPAEGPSIVADTGCQAGKNVLFGDIGLGEKHWYSSCDLGVSGDWVIRAVVDCQSVSVNADVAVSMTTTPGLYTPNSPLTYTITISNAGPGAAANTSVVDILPAAFTGAAWSCSTTGGAICTSGISGSGNIIGSVNLPIGAQVTYTVTGIVATGTTGLITNSVAAVVGSPATDPAGTNNSATTDTAPLSDRIFANGFE